MSLIREMRHRARLIVAPFLGTLAVAYFGYHAVTGDRSLVTWWLLQDRVVEASAMRDAFRSERERLEARVALLAPSHIDPDMLDEQARWGLNFIAPNEVVIITPDGSGTTTPAR